MIDLLFPNPYNKQTIIWHTDVRRYGEGGYARPGWL